MSNEQAPYYLKKLKRRYLLLKLLELLLWSLSVALITYGLATTPGRQTFPYLLSTFAGSIVFVAGFRLFRLHQLTEQKLIRFINQRYPEMQDSTDLLLKENANLSLLEQLQREKTIQRFQEIYPSIKPPHKLGTAVLMLIGSSAIAVLLSSFHLRINNSLAKKSDAISEPVRERKAKLPATIKLLTVEITPPLYTGTRISTSNQPELVIPEGSCAQWRIEFTNEISQAHLIFPGRDSLKLTKSKTQYLAIKTFTESGFYQIQWKGTTGEPKTSDYYKIRIIRDQAPEINIVSLPQSTVLAVTDKLNFTVTSTVADDYNIQDAYIIATVSKGSGESVKFREEKLQFSSPSSMQGKQLKAFRNIDLIKLGLEPGDELYFYAEALDNRQPLPNRSRTETYFISLQDTASENTSVEAGLGVDLMPEYFRSQRQIIIDTEKLLKDKKKISAHAFKSTSNELGYDQKVLRLKYGEFLGEEFETKIGPIESGEETPTEGEDIASRYGHVHDKENEHNLVEDKKQGGKPTQHQHAETGEEKKENPIDAYTHVHDDPEEATFFLQSVRSKLKAALTQMWDAELHLRLYEPEKSLPYQYKALKLLKEVSNDSRIYVHKTGFDPPPLKEEKRLSADLSEIKGTRHQNQLHSPERYPGIREAVQLTEILLAKRATKISSKEKNVLLKGGNELSALALKYPGKFLKALSLIKALNADEINADEFSNALTEIRKALWEALPSQPVSLEQSAQTVHSLDKAFLKNLEELKQ
jgi:hypothetical protein